MTRSTAFTAYSGYRALDLRRQLAGSSTGRSPRFRMQVQPWASCSLHAHVPLLYEQYKLVPAQAGEVTVGLASHWPCVKDTNGLSTYGPNYAKIG